jgi:hypothetical protein
MNNTKEYFKLIDNENHEMKQKLFVAENERKELKDHVLNIESRYRSLVEEMNCYKVNTVQFEKALLEKTKAELVKPVIVMAPLSTTTTKTLANV